MIGKNLVKLVIISLSGIILVLASFGSGLAGESIRLGIAGVHTGELAPFGISIKRGVELAVKEINRKGGIAGRQVKLFIEDDYCRPKEAVTRAVKMVDRKIHAVVGHTCSGATLAALEIYADANIIVISPSATNPVLTRSGRYPNFYRTIAPDDLQAKAQVDFAINALKLNKFAVIHDKSVYGKGLANYVREYLQKSDKANVVLFDGLPRTSVSYSEIVDKIRSSGANAVIYGGYHPGAVKIVTNIHRSSMDIVFISGDGIKDDTFIRSAGKNAEGVYASAPRDTSGNPLAVAANEAYEKEYHSPPGPFFLNAYAATLALCNAIKSTGATDYHALSKALKTEVVETPLGKIRFDDHGDAIGVGFSIYSVRDGIFVEQHF